MLIQLAELNMLQDKRLIDLSPVECYYEVDMYLCCLKVKISVFLRIKYGYLQVLILHWFLNSFEFSLLPQQ